MSKLFEVARTIFWFALRPLLLPELARQTIVILKGREPYFRENSLNYCDQNAVSVKEALSGLDSSWDFAESRELLDVETKSASSRIGESDQLMGGGASLELLYGLTKIGDCKTVLETGVAFGWSSLAILLALHSKPDSYLVSVDMPYVKRNTEHLVGIAVPEKLRHNWTVIRRADREGIPKALKLLGEIDLAHYDSDKSPEGRKFAYPLMWSALREGGIFVSDDVSDNMGFIDFCKTIGQTPIVVRFNDKFAGILIKT